MPLIICNSGLELIFNYYDQNTGEWKGWKIP